MNSAVTLVDFDRLLNGLDHIYSEFSRACGLSDCAYWMLVDTSTAGGSIAVSRLTSEWFYSKQTINSAIRGLEKEGLLYLAQYHGRAKKVVLTDKGNRFAQQTAARIRQAEQDAFASWTEEEVRTHIRLLEKYTECFRREIEKL